MAEGAIERGLRAIAHVRGDARQGPTLAQLPGGELQPPVTQVAHGRLFEQTGEAFGERRARQADRAGQRLAGPGAGRVAVQQGQGAADLRVAQTGQPAGLGRRQRIQMVTHRLDEQQLRQPGQHGGRAGSLAGGLAQGAPERQVEPAAPHDLQRQQRRQQAQQGIFRYLTADETADQPRSLPTPAVTQRCQLDAPRGLNQRHNWWHLALFHLDREQLDEVLALFDGPIFGGRSALALDLVDASALLWRLELLGVAVGARWQPLADLWEAHADAANYAFKDAHAMMAFVGGGRGAAVERVLAAQRRAMAEDTDNQRFTSEVGHPLCLAIQAFAAGDPADSVRLIRPLRAIAQRFGGSHAQRDLLDLTLLEAARRSGQGTLVRPLVNERLQLRPYSPQTRRLALRAAA